MKAEKKVEKLKVNYLFLTVPNWIFIGVLSVALLIFVLISKDLQSILIFVLFFSVPIFALLFITLNATQRAYVDEEGIVIKSALKKIAKIKWEEVCKILINNIEFKTRRRLHRYRFYYGFIVIYTDKNQKAKGWAKNTKNGPIHISLRNDNKKIIFEYYEEYKKNNKNI